MPLIVKDPRGMLTRAPAALRNAADLERRRRAAAADDRDGLGALAHATPLLASRRAARPRGDARRPRRPGRDYVLHATDETVTEYAIEP